MGFDPISFLLGSKAGGGGGSAWTKLAEQDFTVSTTSTTAAQVGTIACGAAVYTDSKIIYVRVRDKAGKREGYFYGSDTFVASGAAGLTTPINIESSLVDTYYYIYSAYQSMHMTSVKTFAGNSAAGVFAFRITTTGNVDIYAKYNSDDSKTIDGTYHVEVYTLEWPDNVSPFA